MKETCLITGAIGHLGPVVVKKLIEEGYAVKVFARQNSPIEVLSGLEVEFAFGDIADRKSIDNALLNVDIVIHAAALIDISNLKVEEMKQVNFVGTKNILDASIEKGIKKFVYVSSSHVAECGVDNVFDGKIFEPEKFDISKANDWYAKTKIMATEYVLKKSKEGKIDACVVAPSGIMGPYSFRISNTHQMIIDFIEGKIPARVNGSYSFVDVRDVAAAIVSAIKNGRNGEFYNLTADTISVNQMFDWLSEKTGIKKPAYVCPMWLVKLFAPCMVKSYIKRGKKPLFSKMALETLETHSEFSHEKAEKELGFKTRSVKDSIFDAVDFALENKQAVLNTKKFTKAKKMELKAKA